MMMMIMMITMMLCNVFMHVLLQFGSYRPTCAHTRFVGCCALQCAHKAERMNLSTQFRRSKFVGKCYWFVIICQDYAHTRIRISTLWFNRPRKQIIVRSMLCMSSFSFFLLLMIIPICCLECITWQGAVTFLTLDSLCSPPLIYTRARFA